MSRDSETVPWNVVDFNSDHWSPQASAGLMKRLQVIYGLMPAFGTTTPTSLQRAWPVRLPSESTIAEESVDGNFTSDLFLAHRDEAQRQKTAKRLRRRLLELVVPSGIFGQEPIDELEDLRRDEDAKSDISDISVGEVGIFDDNWQETEFNIDPLEDEPKDIPCGPDCELRHWMEQSPYKAHAPNPPVLHEPVGEVKDNSTLYIPLLEQQIRILELKPGTGTMPISSELHVFDLAASKSSEGTVRGGPNKYEALSYCWGDSTPTRPITCGRSHVRVTLNLFAALSSLRFPDKSRFVWADALCINQADNIEKGAQVRQMLRLYKTAEKVVIWLGEDGDDDCNLAVKLLIAMDKQEFRRLLFNGEHSAYCIEVLLRAYRAVQKLFSSAWFRRSWIRQELAAGESVVVQYGICTMSWGTLMRSSKRMNGVRSRLLKAGVNSTLPMIATYNLQYLKRDWRYGEKVMEMQGVAGSLYFWHGGGLLELLLVGGKFEATDARDRVYAVLGLAREPLAMVSDQDTLYPVLDKGETLEPMAIDYNASISEVYQRLAKHFINRDLNLDILCFANVLRNQQSSDLPSWTPDWRVQLPELPEGLTLNLNAAALSQAIIQNQTDLGRLQVQAYHSDSVKYLLPITAKVWALLYEDWDLLPADDEGVIQCSENVFNPFDPSRYFNRCCITEKGGCALVPAEARESDPIYVLRGGRLPFVLRKASDQSAKQANEMIVVGTCYLEGYMQGEVFSMMGDEEMVELFLV